MAITLQQIADLAGVSRGTVDRALNNRGRIKPEVEQRIKKIAKDVGYKPSRAGRALAMAKKNIKIGVILQLAQTPFMKDVLIGLKAAKLEAESFGASVKIHKINGVNPTEVIQIMEKMKSEKFNGIALSPSQDNLLIKLIDKFSQEYNIPIITFNSDLENTARLCFIGQNAVKSGQTAAGLMGEITNGQGQLTTPVFAGKPYNTDEQWKLVAEGLNKLGALAAEKDMKLVYHHHMGTGVQTEAEIDKLMEMTDPNLVFLLYDTGHLVCSGEDYIGILKKYINRIKHVHLKDVRKELVEKVKNENMSFLDGVRMGMFTVPGDGCIDFKPVYDILKENNYEGWTMVEAEQDPAIANPLEYAQKARKYIHEVSGL